MHLMERERQWGGVGGRWWSVAEDGDDGEVLGSRCWCRWLVGVQSLMGLYNMFV
ncbi:hypothetical protein Hanom_Chr13g01218151 [Helianthus anomalus]